MRLQVLLLALVVVSSGAPRTYAQATAPAAAGAASPTPTPLPVAVPPEAGSPERRMFEALNAERVRQGLTPVAWSAELATAARLHSADMAANGFLDHDGSDGADQQQRAARQGYLVPPGTGWMVIEAISAMPSMESALNWLLTDGVHRRVLLRAVWREVGIGYAAGGRYGNYWTLDFGCRPNVLPVFASPAADGASLALTFTNELCSSYGGGATQMGRATEVQLATQPDFRDGVWEPFADLRTLARPTGASELQVRLRDANGRLSVPIRLPLTAGADDAAPATPTTTTAPAEPLAPTDPAQPTATPVPTKPPTTRPGSTPRPS